MTSADKTVSGADVTAPPKASYAKHLERFSQWLRLGWYDLIFSYRPSIVGPLWQTLSTGLWAAGLAVVFGPMHGSESNYVPYLIVGVVYWNFISTCITAGSRVFLNNAGILLNMKTPILLHVTRLWANIILKFVFQFLIFVPLIFVFNLKIGFGAFEAFAAFATLAVLGYAIIIVSGLITTRYRDAEHLFTTAVRFLFFMTPIFWMPSGDGTLRSLIATYNPFYYFIDIVRRPLLGESGSPLAWGVTIGALFIMVLAAYVGMRAHRQKIAGWL